MAGRHEPAPSAPPPAPPGLLEYIWRVFALSTVGPLRITHGSKHEVNLVNNTPAQAYLNGSGKPTFVEIRSIPGQREPVLFISGQQSVNVEQSESVNLSEGVYTCITYPSDALYIRQQVQGNTRVMVTEVVL